ncbi:pilus assembly FimT family protein [Caviibacter abscessus]|uniref:pilus assembly FimT family protein n=1 Tax=Caviibacter abscessus TaxID=1766719 RepID=UPI000831F84F|nr:prepilin-type N-terminal cleavage/methylation domain-containing protein [Caviibacter abscessus]
MKRKNKGFTLTEIIIVLFLVSVAYLFTTRLLEYFNEIRAFRTRVKIVNAINYIQNKAIYENKGYEINFNLSNKKIKYIDNVITLDNKFDYITKNKSNDFTRYTTKYGNFDKGFTIQIKRKNKLYYNIIVDTTNALNVPIVKVSK